VYLLRLEQLLAVRSSGRDGAAIGFLSGEHEILEGNLHQCVAVPHSVNVRVLLARTLLAMKRIRPEILPKFEARVRLLQKEHPLAEPAQGVVQRLFDEAFSLTDRAPHRSS
jgi:hypothetical protein